MYWQYRIAGIFRWFKVSFFFRSENVTNGNLNKGIIIIIIAFVGAVLT